MPVTFAMTDQAAEDQGIKVLAYSQSGVGKTTLCATAPAPIILSAEKGLLSLRKQNLERLYGVGTPGISYNIPVIQINTVVDLNDIYRWLTESAEAKPFETFCMDSITEIGEKVLSNSKKLQSDPRKAYGEMADHMIELVKAYRDIPNKNIYVTAKLDKDKDEVSGMMMYGPSMPGKQTGPALPYLFDEVFRLGVAKDKEQKEFRFIQTQPDLQYTAKDRSGTLDSFEPANLTHIFNKIRGIQNGKT